jgi:membrane protein implicated in regulation of membrane protease activity
MEDYLIWIIAGFALVIIELISGTFYLLVFGLGAFVGALAAWLGAPFLVQVLVAGIAAGIGAWFVYRWHATHRKEGGQANAIDIGQSVTMERWVNKTAGVMRVRYRGTDWDARVAENDSAAASAAPGTMLYILAQDGQTWVVGTQKPALNAKIG